MTIGEWFSDKFEVSRGLGGHNVRPIEGLRGFAVSLVFLVHYFALVGQWNGGNDSLDAIADAMHVIGSSGLDLFFVLSGYLIYGSLISKAQPFGKFMRRRLERIYPAFIAVFVIYVALSFTFPSENKIPEGSWAAIGYLAANFFLLPGIFPIQPMITVAWSLSYEMVFYIAVPLLITALGLRRAASKVRLVWFGLILGVVILASINGGPVQLILFVAGMTLFEAINYFKLRPPSSLAGAAALVFGLAATTLPLEGPIGFTIRTCILFAAFFIVCMVCFSRTDGWLSRLFTWTPIRWLGNMSYSYFLLHGLTLKGAFLLVGVLLPSGEYGPIFYWSLLPVMFAASLVPPAILFLCVERPFSLAVRKTPSKKAPTMDHLRNPIEVTS